MKKIFLTLVFFCFFSTYGQELKFVNAPNGLIIREKPSTESTRVGELSYGDIVTVIQKTDIEINITDENQIIKGHWVLINEDLKTPKGYVFSGFLDTEVVNMGNRSENFYLTKLPPNTMKNHSYNMSNSIETKPATIYLRNNKNENVFEFSISDFEMYDSTTLFERKLTTLRNVSSLIIIEDNYNACCSNHYSTYLLISKEGKLSELPEISNMHCDGPEPYETYIFPDEKGGKENTILHVKVTPATKDKLEKNEILKKYYWNGINILE